MVLKIPPHDTFRLGMTSRHGGRRARRTLPKRGKKTGKGCHRARSGGWGEIPRIHFREFCICVTFTRRRRVAPANKDVCTRRSGQRQILRGRLGLSADVHPLVLQIFARRRSAPNRSTTNHATLADGSNWESAKAPDAAGPAVSPPSPQSKLSKFFAAGRV